MYTQNDHTFALCAYKESKYLEECINSLLSQSVKSNIVIYTSTPNESITACAEKYGLEVFVNKGESGIGGDWNFAYNSTETALVTIAHQDDLYEPDYLKEILSLLNRAKEPIIAFCGYGELRDGKKVYNNRLLKIKRIMLCPLKAKAFWNSKFVRRRVLSLGNAICCPAVTLVKEKCGNSPFKNHYKSNLDWETWEYLSNIKGSFAYTKKPLMCHRIHENSTTSELINDNARTKEDLSMYKKFWPDFIAKILVKYYSSSQKSNFQGDKK